MFSSNLWIDSDSKLGEIFVIILEKKKCWSFCCECSSVADLLELTPVRQKLKFSQYFEKDSMENSLGFSLWYLSKYAELTEILMEN